MRIARWRRPRRARSSSAGSVRTASGGQPALGAARDLALPWIGNLDLARPALGAGGDRRHEAGVMPGCARAMLAAGARAAEVSIVHLHPPRQPSAMRASFPGRLLDPETAPQLTEESNDHRPRASAALGGWKMRARRGGCLLLHALVEAPARQHTMPAMAARRCRPASAAGTIERHRKASRNASSLGPAHPRCHLEPHIRNLPRQERTKNICLPKRSVTDKQDRVCEPQVSGTARLLNVR